MEDIIRFETVNQYNAFNQQETLHPLVTVIDLSTASPRKKTSQYMGCYGIFLKDVVCGDLRYGKEYYDYQEGTLVFMSPGQVFTVENDGELYQPKGHALVFHPDLLLGTSLNGKMQEFSFFGFQVNEALHLSQRERQIVMDCFGKIKYELEHAIDKHSRKLIVANLELFLDYCTRFYDRQFLTRDNIHRGILAKFESLLSSYFSSEKPQTIGLPSVSYCADELNLSAKYFGDLIKRETGQTAQEYIQMRVIEAAKERIFSSDKTVNEIAFELGFKYPQHFSRLFKQRIGQTPNEYRILNNLN
ncbi:MULTISPECIES: AraC family transcriptional regulator [Dyadobacter]|uniref:Helix-turn-helix domain-containing protein n=1 Tax=Dyadobacter chenhuakuii TaxID=2909339 RepID=A0ABY4XRT2_9BACT|nr:MULTISPECIES: helix-turn-helix domain-containing protein [Dyadobacter]MCF2492871.1 helix-turn-helix domain-containing protein [Dyadobacter chenhuakuii]MCF2517757.1 helix-turn-helix domain-containing protein [Dyadobacter sp. CY351]USJ32839.1 helix-turn-helix domain-containing protein [Dyadobacter chenhuakuii]